MSVPVPDWVTSGPDADGNFSGPAPKQISDWSVFWLTIGLAVAIGVIGWATA